MTSNFSCQRRTGFPALLPLDGRTQESTTAASFNRLPHMRVRLATDGFQPLEHTK